MTKEFDMIEKLLSNIRTQNVEPLHIVFNTNFIDNNLDLTDFLIESAKDKDVSALKDNDFCSVLFGIRCSYLLLGANEIFFIVLTDNPMISPLVAKNTLLNDELEKYSSDYVM